LQNDGQSLFIFTVLERDKLFLQGDRSRDKHHIFKKDKMKILKGSDWK